MNKIGVKVETSLKILLRELLEFEFIENDIEKTCKIVILDVNIPFFEKEVAYYYSCGIGIIALLDDWNIERLKSKCIFEYVLKNEVEKIKNAIERYLLSVKSYSSFYLNDIYFKGIIEFSEILFIDYCRTTRKVRFNLINGESFFIKRNFSDLDFLTLDFENFYKLGRGVIINIDLVKFLDYKEEKIIFKDKTVLYISKVKLKELENTGAFEKGKVVLKSI